MADHTHAVAGGGTKSHEHDIADGDKSHSHAPNSEDNPTDKKLLPFQNKLSERHPEDAALLALMSEKVELGEDECRSYAPVSGTSTPTTAS